MFWQLSHANSLPDIALLLYPVLGLIALTSFWYLISTPVTSATINSNGDVTLTWRYLIRRESKVFHATSLEKPTLKETIDSDKDSQWSVQLDLPDGSVFRLVEAAVWSGSGRNERAKERCERIRAEFIESLRHFRE